jgi:hypothetical protein
MVGYHGGAKGLRYIEEPAKDPIGWDRLIGRILPSFRNCQSFEERAWLITWLMEST